MPSRGVGGRGDVILDRPPILATDPPGIEQKQMSPLSRKPDGGGPHKRKKTAL